MGFISGLLCYGLGYHAAEKRLSSRGKRMVPFETTIKVSVPIDDDTDLDDLDLDEVLSGVDIDLPPGVTIDNIQITARKKKRR